LEAFQAFVLDLLDSLDAHIAVLDSKGAIVAVNDAWKRFGSANGATGEASAPGTSYLAVCARAAAAGDPYARAMLEGLHDVLARRHERFRLEYPCNSPGQARWYRAVVTRFFHRGATYVAVIHEDTTDRRRVEDELKAVLERERLRASTDELTSLSNRRHFFELATQAFAVAQRYQTPMSLIMLDIDHFKRVNDARGHQAGDVILQRVAAIARAQTRASDILARYGGEEFVVALPGTAAGEGFAVSEKIRQAVAAQLEVTISGGVSQACAAPDTLDALIGRADRALYEAKNSGRDRTCMAPPPAWDPTG